jgi:fatty-acyl-CoA synthase
MTGRFAGVGPLANFGQSVSLGARLFPGRVGARDLDRSMTFLEWDRRANRLANGLLGLGLVKGDRVAVLAYNCVEWLEIYAAAAKAGLVVVPVNFRLRPPEIRYILRDCGARAFIVQDALIGPAEEVRGDIGIPDAAHVWFGGARCPAGFRAYEDLLAGASDVEPAVAVALADPWCFLYTSGTTGNPKGAIRSHRASAMLSLINDVEIGLTRHDTALLVMPMCHANSLYFASALLFAGGSNFVYSRSSFDPEHLVRTLSEGAATFTSLVPTQYIFILALEETVKARYDVSRMQKLMISSAPARRDTKLAVLDYFRNSGLFELYGSTEGGWATMLHPHEQFDRLGSVGRELVGTMPNRLLDEDGNDVPEGEVGEIFFSNPYTFDGYWNLPEKTKEAFRGDYCTVGDLARRDEQGYYYLVDRKSNMIISGGENIYPTEIENVVGSHPLVREVAVVGVPDETWGERVHAVVVPHEGATLRAEDIMDWCRDRVAGFKRPRSVSFAREEEIPRTATGKVQHRILKKRFEA